MKIYRGFCIIICVLSSFKEILVKSKIRVNNTFLVHNRHKRQVFQLLRNNFHLECCTDNFFKRHIRRGTCRFVLDNEAQGNINFRGELRYIIEKWQGFANNGFRHTHSFILHHNLDYNGISDRLYHAIAMNFHRRYNPNHPRDDHNLDRPNPGRYWFVDLPANDLGDLEVVQLTGIQWRFGGDHVYFRMYQDCKCGRVEITLGFKYIPREDLQFKIEINHFERQQVPNSDCP